MTINQIADEYVKASIALSPEFATALGLEENQDRWGDYSPAGVEAEADLARETVKKLQQAEPVDAGESVTKAAMLDRLGVALDRHALGEPLRDLNNIACPIQSVRDTLAQMDTSTAEGKANVAARIARMGEAYRGYAQTLAEGAARGLVPAQRQVQRGIEQLQAMAAEQSLLDVYGAEAEATAEQVAAGKQAAAELATFLEEQIAPHAAATDGVGRERYEVASHLWVGHRIDLDDTYEWGLEELQRIIAEQEVCAAELYGKGTSPTAAFERLNTDPAYQLHGVDELQQWMQQIADDVIAKMNGTYFDIPEPVQHIECCIDKAGTGGIFYTEPAADFSRPGRMWWSVPEDEDTFNTWQELTTVYHEGVPGHHLQLGQQVYEAEHLNSWRRHMGFNSGHAEGWALYAERFMDELGFLPDAGYRMGMLDGQRLRAARVALDIGVHLGKSTPDGGMWDADYAWQFMKNNVAMADGFLRFEVDRYLGWPGQAPSYKVGQRLWEQLRDDFLAARPGELKEFHRLALREGTLPMGVLREVVMAQA